MTTCSDELYAYSDMHSNKQTAVAHVFSSAATFGDVFVTWEIFA